MARHLWTSGRTFQLLEQLYPHHFPEKLIPLTILNALDGLPLPVYGAGANVRDWLYVEDHMRALELVMWRGWIGESYNVGGQRERTNLSVVKTICGILDEVRPLKDAQLRRTPIKFVKDRPGHDRRYAIDPAKIETELGWQAQKTSDTGIRKTVGWYLNNVWWWHRIREKVYSGQRLGAGVR